MLVYRGTEFDRIDKSAVTIGKFDGIHLGHLSLVEEVVGSSYPALMLTFLFEGQKSIYSDEEKKKLAESLGIDIYVEVPATREFFSIEPEEFIETFLCEKLGARMVVVGSDFQFGKDRTGDVNTLEKFSGKHGYELVTKEKLKDTEDKIISSTRVRDYLIKGELDRVEELLGRKYSITGTVTDGMRLGRKIDVPTANVIPTDDKLLPPFGVYAVSVDGRYGGVANIGIKPTVGSGNPIGVEVNIFDFDGDLYNKEIKIDLIEFIRGEKKFDSIDMLKKQIEKDTEKAKDILKL
ncbi:MAG: bifunctional riboflavin kinase/FAD synthetase [Eubacterium sp.]|nr:bifunctional riboflavin kinase/FAD synthetase [Eubacterium sp.]